MAITSWTSEGMVWNLPNLLEAPIEYKWIEAVRLAIIERMTAIYGLASDGGPYPFDPNTFPPIVAGDVVKHGAFGGLVDGFLLNSIIGNCLRHDIGNFSGQRYAPPWTESTMLTAIGGPATWEYAIQGAPLTATWLWQAYNVLNRCLWVRHPFIYGVPVADGYSICLSCDSRTSSFGHADENAAWAASTWVPVAGVTGFPRIIASRVRPAGYPIQYELANRSRAHVRYRYINPTLQYDWQVIMGVARGYQDNQYSDHGTGYAENTWQEQASGLASTASTQEAYLGYDDTIPPSSPASPMRIGWHGSGAWLPTALTPDTTGDCIGFIGTIGSNQIKWGPWLVRKYNRTGGFQFVA